MATGGDGKIRADLYLVGASEAQTTREIAFSAPRRHV
jgi:hypothetical protein